MVDANNRERGRRGGTRVRYWELRWFVRKSRRQLKYFNWPGQPGPFPHARPNFAALPPAETNRVLSSPNN